MGFQLPSLIQGWARLSPGSKEKNSHLASTDVDNQSDLDFFDVSLTDYALWYTLDLKSLCSIVNGYGDYQIAPEEL